MPETQIQIILEVDAIEVGQIISNILNFMEQHRIAVHNDG